MSSQTQRQRIKDLEREVKALKDDVRTLHGMFMQLKDGHNRLVEVVKQMSKEREDTASRILLP